MEENKDYLIYTNLYNVVARRGAMITKYINSAATFRDIRLKEQIIKIDVALDDFYGKRPLVIWFITIRDTKLLKAFVKKKIPPVATDLLLVAVDDCTKFITPSNDVHRQCSSFAPFLVDDHVLVMEHTLITDDEIEDLGYPKQYLPPISTQDAQIIRIGGRHGSVVKINSLSETAITSTIYKHIQSNII